MNTVIYARVSTGVQTLDQQIAACRNLVPDGEEPIILQEQRRGWDYEGESQYRQLVSLVERRKVEMVIVFKLDRLGRNAREVYNFVDDCKQRGIVVKSVGDQCDTTTALGMLIVGVYASIAEMEKETMSCRIRAKFDQMKEDFGYRGHGSMGGWFSEKAIGKEKAIRTLAASGMGSWTISKQVGIDHRTVKRMLQQDEGTLKTKAQLAKDNPGWYETPAEQKAQHDASKDAPTKKARKPKKR